MTPEFYLIIGFLLCASIVGSVFVVIHYGKRYIDDKLEGFFLKTRNDIAINTDGQLLSWRNDLKLEINEKLANFQPKAQTAPEAPRDFWNNKKQLKETLAGLSGADADVPNIPQLQNMSINDAYHAIQDRIEELEA